MTAKLAKNASGIRHLRWGREVLASLNSHLKLNYLLTPVQRQALQAETTIFGAYVAGLDATVTPYRSYLDTAYTEIRADQRVGDYLCDDSFRHADGGLKPYSEDIKSYISGGFPAILSNLVLSRVLSSGRVRTVELVRHAALLIGSLPPAIPIAQSLSESLTKAANVLDDANKRRAELIDPQRKPLRFAMLRAVMDLREASEQMDGRLRTHFNARFIDSLYPELQSNRMTIVDDEEDEVDENGPVTVDSGD
ncbi:MAG: hypothetical protein HUU55_01595 [Myxococcales bacterium]|nr:hypothetical protein [Myxococcales bacterium]